MTPHCFLSCEPLMSPNSTVHLRNGKSPLRLKLVGGPDIPQAMAHRPGATGKPGIQLATQLLDAVERDPPRQSGSMTYLGR